MFTKAQQLAKVKTPKQKSKSKNKSTNEEQSYLHWLQSQFYPCFVCGSYSNIEYHHIKFKSTDKKRHNKLIPLCWNHHHGRELSPHGNTKQWRETYTMEAQEQRADVIYQDYLKEL